MKKVNWITWLLAGSVVALTSACHHSASQPAAMHGEQFPNEQELGPVSNVVLAQESTGAREDATLYVADFTGDSLNSLGQSKLDLMMADEEAPLPMAVYLDVPADAPLDPMRQSVSEYLKNHGMTEAQFKVQGGANPASHTPVANTVAVLQSQDSGSPTATAGPSATAAPQTATPPSH